MSEPVTAAGVERDRDYVSPGKDNQKALRENIESAFDEPVSRRPAPKKRTGRVEQRSIEAVAEAAGIKDERPAGRPICRCTDRVRSKKGPGRKPRKPSTSSLPAACTALPVILQANRGPFGHRNHASSVMSQTS
jgi:hypothetical protein